MLNQVLTSGVDFDPAGSAAAAQAASQPLDADLTAIAALTTTSFGRGGLTQVDAAAFRTYIGAGTGSGNALTSNPLSQFASTTSAQLAGVMSDETGTGLLVFNTSPTFVTPILGTPTSGNLANCTGYVIDLTAAYVWTGQHTFSNATTNFGAAAVPATLQQVAPASGAGNPITLAASAAASGNTNGGNVALKPGAKAGAGTDGYTEILQPGQSSGSANALRLYYGGSNTCPVIESGVAGMDFRTSSGLILRMFQLGNANFANGCTVAMGQLSLNSSPNNIVILGDTGLARNAAGIIEANTGTVGVFGAIKCGQPAVGTTGLTVKGIASRTVALLNLQTSAGASLGNVGGTVFNDFTDTSTTHTDGTEDDLYSYTTVANTLIINGDSVSQKEEIHIVANSTATRRIKKYFAGTLIWDSGDVTGQLNLTGQVNTELWLETTIIRESSTVVRVTVRSITTFTVATVPFVTYTRITGLTLTGTNILKTTGIASGSGSASGDITNRMSKVITEPAA